MTHSRVPIIDLGPRYASSGEIEAGRQTAFIRYGRHLWELGETQLVTFGDEGAPVLGLDCKERRFRVRVLTVIRAELRDLTAQVLLRAGCRSHQELRTVLERHEMTSSPRRPDDMSKSSVTVLLSSRVTAMTFELLRGVVSRDTASTTRQ